MVTSGRRNRGGEVEISRFLLACASRRGGPAEIAEEIGDVLRRDVPVAVVPVRDAAGVRTAVYPVDAAGARP